MPRNEEPPAEEAAMPGLVVADTAEAAETPGLPKLVPVPGGPANQKAHIITEIRKLPTPDFEIVTARKLKQRVQTIKSPDLVSWASTRPKRACRRTKSTASAPLARPTGPILIQLNPNLFRSSSFMQTLQSPDSPVPIPPTLDLISAPNKAQKKLVADLIPNKRVADFTISSSAKPRLLPKPGPIPVLPGIPIPRLASRKTPKTTPKAPKTPKSKTGSPKTVSVPPVPGLVSDKKPAEPEPEKEEKKKSPTKGEKEEKKSPTKDEKKEEKKSPTKDEEKEEKEEEAPSPDPSNYTENLRISQREQSGLIRNGHKQFPCSTCLKVFSQRLHLQRHVKSVHEGIRDNLCAFCGKGFMLKSHLMEHIRAVHFKIKNHVCLFCDWKFNRVGDLNRHIKTVHTQGKKKRKRRSQPSEDSIGFIGDENGSGIIDLISDQDYSDQDYSRDSSFYDQPLSSNSGSLSPPTESAPLSLTDRYITDYKKRLLEREKRDNNNSESDLEIQDDEIVLFPQ